MGKTWPPRVIRPAKVFIRPAKSEDFFFQRISTAKQAEEFNFQLFQVFLYGFNYRKNRELSFNIAS